MADTIRGARTGYDVKLKEAGDGSLIPYVAIESVAAATTSSAIVIGPTAGSKTVTTAGTGVPLFSSSTKAFSVLVIPKAANTDSVFFGSSAVDKTSSPQMTLPKGAPPVTITAPPGYVLDLSQWYIDSNVNGEGVDFVYIS